MEEQANNSIAFLIIAFVVYMLVTLLSMHFSNKKRRLLDDVLDHGMLDKADGRRYRVKKGLFDEYILIDRKTGESFIMSEKHLLECLKKEKLNGVTSNGKPYYYSKCIITYEYNDYTPFNEQPPYP